MGLDKKNISIVILSVSALLSSCAGYRLHQADEAYNLMAYQKAQMLYDRVLRHTPDDRQALIKCADACRRQNEMEAAAAHYHRADSIEPLTGDDSYRYGLVLMSTGDEHAAEEQFFRVLQDRPEDLASLDLYGSCQGYRSFLNDPDKFVVNRLTLPGMHSVFSAFPYRKGLIVTGEQTAPKANPWNGQSYLDLYYSERRTMVTWEDAQPLPGKVNGPYHEGSAVLSPNGRTLYFTRSDYYKHRLNKDGANTSHLMLFRASLDTITGEWTDIRAFAYNGEDFSTGHPALSANGKILYFASDRPGGHGGSDIWRCHDNGSGWSAPENLGATVNTPGNELFPVINGSSLYFSSTAHDNMGGLDIFESHELNGRWSDPVNMNYPVNTEHDDFGFVVDPHLDLNGSGQMSGYLSSDRDGLDQVYTFWAVAPTIFVEGEVKDPEGRFLPNTEVNLAQLLTEEDTSIMTDAAGRYRFRLKPNTDYTVRVKDQRYLSQAEAVSTKGIVNSDTLHVDLELMAINLDQPISIKNILYDYDKWDIRPDAARELDKLARLFMENPHMTFELGAHTDSRGGDVYNLVLSDARANSAVNYLIQQGVDPDRITAKGFGETVLTNRCANGVRCTEEEHQANRRTEFRVTGIRNLAQER